MGQYGHMATEAGVRIFAAEQCVHVYLCIYKTMFT